MDAGLAFRTVACPLKLKICAKTWIEGIFLTFSPLYKNGGDGQVDA